jgi:hypothetical protein
MTSFLLKNTCIKFAWRGHSTGKAKVAEFDNPLLGDQYVLRFNITVDNLKKNYVLLRKEVDFLVRRV